MSCGYSHDMEYVSVEKAACAGMAAMFYDPQRATEAIAVCQQCAYQSDCLRHAINSMFTDSGTPIAWLVHAGLLPAAQERLWYESCGDGDTAIVLARQQYLITR